ncbi:MAG: 50S ribosomal protein L10 [Nitrospiria bacterium]
MNREKKQEHISQLNEKFSRASVAILAEFTGMGVEEMREVRKGLRGAEGEFKVVKNTIAIRAATGTSLEGIHAYFKGSTAVALGYADPVAPTKALKEIADKQDKLKIKAGVVEGKVVDLAGVRQIAKLPPKDILLGELIGRLNAPISGFAGCLNGVLSKFVRTLEAVHQQRLDSK